MPLAPVPNQRGLWINSDTKPGDPGVFALIIGVSRYDHLTGGATPASDSYGLGQLAVSALTAFRFFEWLREGYALNGWPVASARLLLSPIKKGVTGATSDELSGCDAKICDNALEATYANCRSAIENWYADMQAIAAPASGRSLFFFSGHGLELKQSHQVLLPSDYLRPPIQPINEAISTRNLIDCLPYLAHVGSHVLLLDACRNDFDRLRGLKVEGADILNDNVPGATNANCDKGVLYSTASGRQAFQPKSNGISLFGQALLDGLRTKPAPMLDEAPIELRCRGNVCTVEINNLTSYIKGRIAALIKAANESVVQVVRSEVSSSGNPIELAEVSNTRATAGAPSPMVEEIFVLNKVESKRKPRAQPPAQRRAAATKEREAWLARRYSVGKKPGKPLAAGADKSKHFKQLHDVLGSETVTDPWVDSLQVTGLTTRSSVNHSGVEIVATRQGKRTGPLHRVQIHFRVANQDDPVGHLLTIEDMHHRRFGCVLPRDGYRVPARPIYQLEIDVGESDAGFDSFIRFAAYLSPQNSGWLGKAAAVWERLRALNPSAATNLVEASHITLGIEAARRSEDVLEKKVRSPLAATVAGLVLLKANRFDLMHDWARNVGNWFPWIPDGIVIWTEQCRRMAARGDQQLDPMVIPWFVKELAGRSLPFTADGFGLAADIVRDIQRERIKTDSRTRREVDKLANRIDRAMPYFRDDGLFSSYAAWTDDLNLSDMIGPPRATRQRPRKAATKQQAAIPAKVSRPRRKRQ